MAATRAGADPEGGPGGPWPPPNCKISHGKNFASKRHLKEIERPVNDQDENITIIA